jgi:hypothetical protein
VYGDAFLATNSDYVTGYGDAAINDNHDVQMDQRDFADGFLFACDTQSGLMFAEEGSPAFDDKFHDGVLLDILWLLNNTSENKYKKRSRRVCGIWLGI